MQYIIKTVQIGTQYQVPIIICKRRKRIVSRQAGIQHHAVICAVCLNVGSQNFSAGFAVGHVKLQHARIPTQCTDFFRDGFRFITAAAAVDDNIKTVLRQTKRDGFADTAIRPCN